MAVRQKPSRTATVEKPQQNENEIATLINKGGSIATERAGQQPTKNVQLRLTDPLITAIDTSCNKRFPKPPRHSWLLEAIMEKLEREKLEH